MEFDFRSPTTAATTFAKTSTKPSTTTTEQPADEDIEYEDEDEVEDEQPVQSSDDPVDPKFKDALEEEDPEVIKELITLIKKVGGLDELEKQLQFRLSLNENSPIVNGGAKTTTTMSPISKSLYDKVISTRRGLAQNRKETAFGSTRATPENGTESLVQRQNKENRYSSVVRNSRPRPQNDGIDKLTEADGGGVLHERPQYVTIMRTRTSTVAGSEFDDDDEEIADDQIDSEENTDEGEEDDDVGAGEQPARSKSTTTHQPTHSYVNIRRSRPTSSTTETHADDDEDEDDSSSGKQTTRMQYVSIKRTRPNSQQSNDDVIDATPESK